MEKKDLPKAKTERFAMVFAYGPDGPVVCTGSLQAIVKDRSSLPTHHGFVSFYRNGIRMAASPSKSVILLGKYGFSATSLAFKSFPHGHLQLVRYQKVDPALLQHAPWASTKRHIWCLFYVLNNDNT